MGLFWHGQRGAQPEIWNLLHLGTHFCVVTRCLMTSWEYLNLFKIWQNSLMSIFTSCLICTLQGKKKRKWKKNQKQTVGLQKSYTFLSLLDYHIYKVLHTIAEILHTIVRAIIMSFYSLKETHSKANIWNYKEGWQQQLGVAEMLQLLKDDCIQVTPRQDFSSHSRECQYSLAARAQ